MGGHLGFICTEGNGCQGLKRSRRLKQNWHYFKIAVRNPKRSMSTILRKIGDCEQSKRYIIHTNLSKISVYDPGLYRIYMWSAAHIDADISPTNCTNRPILCKGAFYILLFLYMPTNSIILQFSFCDAIISFLYRPCPISKHPAFKIRPSTCFTYVETISKAKTSL